MSALDALEAAARRGETVDPAAYARARAAADLDALAAPALAARDRDRQAQADRVRALDAHLAGRLSDFAVELDQRAGELIGALRDLVRCVVDAAAETRPTVTEPARLRAVLGRDAPPARWSPGNRPDAVLADLAGWLGEALHVGLVEGSAAGATLPRNVRTSERSDRHNGGYRVER